MFLWILSLVAAAQLAVHLVEVVLVIVLPGDALLFILIRDACGGLVVLLLPGPDGELVLLLGLPPEDVVMQSLAAVDARPVWHNRAVGELLNAEPLRAEATHLIDELAVGLLYVVLEIGPREGENPEDLVEAQIAGGCGLWVLEVRLEALAVCKEALAELAELVGLCVVHNRVDSGLAEQALGVDGAVRHFVLNNRVILLFEGTVFLRGPLYQFYYEIESLYTKNRGYRGPLWPLWGPSVFVLPYSIS